MYMPFSFLMVFLLLFGTILSLSSLSWLGVWLGLELNMLCFVPVLVYLSSFQTVEGMVKYFLVQSLGSVFLLFSGLVVGYGFVFCVDYIFFFFFLSSLFLKLGVFPLHWWFPSVLGSFGWFGVLLLSTWQKVGPFFLFLFFSSFSYLFLFFSSLSSVVGGFCGLGQTNSRFLLAYSAIGHLGWMVSAGFFSFFFGLFYFLVYLMLSLFLVLFFWYFDISRFSQVFSFSFFLFFMFFTCLFSLCGVPPFIGFFSKLLVFFSLLYLGGFYLFLFFLLVGSLVSLYFYLGLFFSFFFSFVSTFSFFSFSLFSFFLFFSSFFFFFSFFFFDFLFALF